MGYEMQGLGALERLHKGKGVAPFWVWGKLAVVMEPKTPSSRPRKLSYAALCEAKASSNLLGTQSHPLHSQG